MHYDTVAVGDQRLKGGSEGAAQSLDYWLIASRAENGRDTSSTWYLVSMESSNDRLIRLAGLVLLAMEHRDATMGRSEDTGESLYQVDMGHRSSLVWEGHLAGDSAAAAPRISQNWIVPGQRGTVFRASVELAPTSTQPVAGILRLSGKADIVKALGDSPLRMLGPAVWGGEGSFRFIR